MRFYLGVHKFAPTLAMFGDLGWIPVKYSQYMGMLRFWNRLVNCPHERMLYKVFEWDYNECNNNWCSDVKNIFEQIDMLDVFENQSVCNLSVAQAKFLELYKEQWPINVTDKVKLRTYNRFKKAHKVENYIQLNLNRADRSIFAQLRLGILPINIEAGRFRRLKVEESICPICLNGVEDECHFLFICPLYENIREDLTDVIKVEHSNFDNLVKDEKLNLLMNSYRRETAKFIRKAYARRRETLCTTSR